jgi:hypothetical protein
MDHKKNRPDNRRDNRVPDGLSFLMWPALVRAPWMIGTFFETDARREAERRRKRDR